MTLEIIAEKFQYHFLNSSKRFPALVAGVGTGKTLFMLLKIWEYCLKFPDSLALIVRREYVDLRDSTLKDFERYFEVKVDGNKEYHFPNKSCIMFRHGSELDVLKNLNLSIFGIEQAEEFESEETFTYLRDRLRRENAPYRQGVIIANTNGHNWIWKNWKNNPQSEEYNLFEATTFDNKDNLPEDFIKDLESMAKEAPNHYNRYVMNSWEELEDADILIRFDLIEESAHRSLYADGAKILSVDVARFGDDKTSFSIIQKAAGGWKQVYKFNFKGQDTVKTFGHAIDLKRQHKVDFIVVDDDGIGGGVVDNLRAASCERVYQFNAQGASTRPEQFYRKRDECYWKLKELFERGEIQIINDNDLVTQLSAIRFSYLPGSGAKKIETKDKMKERGLKSPDDADALMMSMMVLDQAGGLDPKQTTSFKVYAPTKTTYMPSVYRKPQLARR